jgi:hypothetical protein
MLVRTIDGAVKAVPFVVTVRLEREEKAVPFARLRPSVEAIEHGFPRAELRWEVAPRYARPAPPQHCFEEPAIIIGRPACSTFRPKKRFDLRPLSL